MQIVELLLVENLPATQAVHRDAPLDKGETPFQTQSQGVQRGESTFDTVYVPDEQAAQTVRPLLSENLPLAHSWQMDTPVVAVLNVPAVQLVQTVELLLVPKRPAPQAVREKMPGKACTCPRRTCRTDGSATAVGELAIRA